MYIFKNVFKNIFVFKAKTILMFIIIFILSLLCCLSLIVWQAAKKYEESNKALMNVSVDFGSDLSMADADTVFILYESIETSISSEVILDKNAETLEELHKFADMGNPIAAHNIISTHLLGSENFKSYVLDSNSGYLALTKSKIATAFFDRQYINIIGCNPEEFSENLGLTDFKIDEGEMFDESTFEYECIIAVQFAHSRELEIGDKIDIYLNDLEYELKVTGFYTSSTSRFTWPWLKIDKGKPNFLNQPNYSSNYYFPTVYVNNSFYEEIQTKRAVGLDLVFNVVGFPSDEAMLDFINGNTVIAYGKVFDTSSDDYECLISENLAKKNQVKVGDEIILRANLGNSQNYRFKIVGIYYDSYGDGINSSAGAYEIPLDTIYMSSPALLRLINDIDSYSSASYPILFNLKLVFKDTNDMNDFYRKVIKQNFSLRKKFETSSQNVSEYFNQLTIIKRTTSYALVTFMLEIVVAIVFLFMFNAYNLRERQYEIGVLTSMGMSKGKIALQFFSEIIIVVLAATLLGSALGTIASGSVGNYLTRQNIESKEDQRIALIENFGREVNMPNIDSTQDLTIDASLSYVTLLWLLGAFVAVTIFSTSGTISFILGFEPVAILNDRQ